MKLGISLSLSLLICKMGILQVYCEAEGNYAQEEGSGQKVFSACLLKKSFIPFGTAGGAARQPSILLEWSETTQLI